MGQKIELVTESDLRYCNIVFVKNLSSKTMEKFIDSDDQLILVHVDETSSIEIPDIKNGIRVIAFGDGSVFTDPKAASLLIATTIRDFAPHLAHINIDDNAC